MGVPYTFSTSTSSIPLSQLDTNFATPVTIGSTTVALGNTTTTLAGLTGVTSSAITDSALTANQIVYAGTGGLLSGSSNYTYDTNGNVLLGTTTAFTSTTYGGQFVSGGVGIYPWINVNTGIANTTNYTGVVYQNPTVWSGNNGASNQFLYGIYSGHQISNTGASGSGQVQVYGIYSSPYLASSGTNAYIGLRGVYGIATRTSATDTSTYASNFLQGGNFSATHTATLASTAFSTSIRGVQASSQISSGSTNELSCLETILSAGNSTTNSNTINVTNSYVLYSNTVTVGTASNQTGIITNHYDCYFPNPTINTLGTITNKWSIYSANTGNSYLAGSLGIGTTTPAGKLDVAGTIKTLGYTVATLPTGTVGMRAYATDALTPVFGSTVVGGGAVVIPVFYNGSNWIVG